MFRSREVVASGRRALSMCPVGAPVSRPPATDASGSSRGTLCSKAAVASLEIEDLPYEAWKAIRAAAPLLAAGPFARSNPSPVPARQRWRTPVSDEALCAGSERTSSCTGEAARSVPKSANPNGLPNVASARLVASVSAPFRPTSCASAAEDARPSPVPWPSLITT